MTKGKGARKTSTRSEIVTVRLEPKLRYLADLAARKQRRTVSSFVECAVEEHLRGVELTMGVPLTTEAKVLWGTDEPTRFVRLALAHEELLTHEEQVLWQLLKENSAFWDHSRIDGLDDIQSELNYTIGALDLVLLRSFWDLLKRVARGEASPDDLPSGIKIREAELSIRRKNSSHAKGK